MEKKQQSKQECHTKQNAPQNCKNFKLRWVFGCIQAFGGTSQKNMGEKGEATVRWYLYNTISGVYTHCADIFITEWVVGWTRVISLSIRTSMIKCINIAERWESIESKHQATTANKKQTYQKPKVALDWWNVCTAKAKMHPNYKYANVNAAYEARGRILPCGQTIMKEVNK